MSQQKLALQGGLKAVGKIEGKGRPKIGVEEFMSVAERFGFSKRVLRKIRQAVAKEDMDTGPFLANYYADLAETKVRAFERVARETFGTKYAIGVSSGTGALHSAFVAAGVGRGAEVICSAIGFFATAAAVVEARGVPVFCDVDESLHMDPDKIEALITDRTVAISPTHVMGGVADMTAIMKIARKHKLEVIEDCAQSCGGTYKGKFVGTFGDIGIFSISAYKIVGGGEGGLMLIKNKRLWERAQGTVECGGLWRPDRFARPRYDGEIFCGTNYRMSELEAAVDVVQLGKMIEIVKRFRAVNKRIIDKLHTFEEILPRKLNDRRGEVGYLLRFFPESVDLSVKICRALAAEGIAAGTRGKKPGPDWHIYSQMYPLMTECGPKNPNCGFECHQRLTKRKRPRYARGDCPVADDLYDRMVTIGLNQWYTTKDCRNIATGINKVLSAYCKENPHATAWT